MRANLLILAISLAATVSQGFLQAQDGQNLGDGLPLLFTQDTPTGFGNATGGGQDSSGGSEINAVWGGLSSGTLNFAISGNLEGNFNKFFLFFDAVDGGENVLLSDNVDGGFNEVQNLAGLTFDSGFSASHGMRVEIGGGFYSIRGMDLINNTAFDIVTGGGPGDLPLSGVGSGGVLLGWDNSNVLGVDSTSANDALTATTGWEFSVDVATFFGAGALNRDILLAGFITSGDGLFVSNQVIGGLGGAGNLGDPSVIDFNSVAGNQFVTFAIPEPGTAVVLTIGLIGLAHVRRRTVV